MTIREATESDWPAVWALFQATAAGGDVFAQFVRWTIPRFRFDQLMSLAWKVMLPLGLVNLVAVATIATRLDVLTDFTSDKAVRVANYQKNMIKEISVIAHSCGVKNPRHLQRKQARIVESSAASISLTQYYKRKD